MKKIPQRMCIVTKEKTDKNKLLRIVKDDTGVYVDTTGKKNGKGAYITKSLEVLETAKKRKVLEKVFEMEDLTSVYSEIEELLK